MLRLNRKILESKGEVSNDRKERQEILQNNYEKLFSSAQTMSDLLNEPLPELPKDEQVQTGGVVLEADDTNEALDPWGDEETRSFYVDLPDLRIFLPNYAPKIQNVQTEEPAMSEEVLDMEIEPEQLEVDESVATSEEFGKSTTPEPMVPEEPVNTASEKTTTSTTTSGHATKQQFASFLQNLANCVNKELIDSAAIEFLLNLNTKNNRKKVCQTLFGVQR